MTITEMIFDKLSEEEKVFVRLKYETPREWLQLALDEGLAYYVDAVEDNGGVPYEPEIVAEVERQAMMSLSGER